MISAPTLAALRFGTGLSPNLPAPEGAEAVLAALAGPDVMARRYPQDGWDTRVADARAWVRLRKTRDRSEADKEAWQDLLARVLGNLARDMGTHIARATQTQDGLRERLMWFWADHFTVAGTRGYFRQTIPGYVEDVIRPHVTGRFADMLMAVVTHPAMVFYLDQDRSIGPNSRLGQRRGERGLNENLAREILELHTLGVGAGYGQRDVRELAELLTGVTSDREGVALFRPQFAEPGTEEILGQTFGGDPAQLSHIRDAMQALAVHPDTARHIARKLVVHFIADTPPPAMVDRLAQVWLDSGGDLGAVTAALVRDPDSWTMPLTKVRQPMEFMCAAVRALGLGADAPDAGRRVMRDTFWAPLRLMGQPWYAAPGPDGWPEEAEAWITPQALAARIDWAMTQPAALMGTTLPDPRSFIDQALADAASPRLRFAAEAAEDRAAGIGLILSSAEFQRR